MSKKELRRQVEAQLSNTFINLEGEISKKKFRRNIKKASKALLAGLKITPAKDKEPRESSIEAEIQK